MTGAQGMFMRRDYRPADTSWHSEGACYGGDDTLFFHPYGERGRERRMRAEAAKAICRTCPVMMTCREESLRVREQNGTWGGMSEDERKAWFRKQQPSRQPKSVSA